MRSHFRTLALIAGLIATFSVGALAAGQKAAPKAKNRTAVGTISSISGNQLVLTEKVKGKDTQVTYMIDSSTQKTGNLVAGNSATVAYHSENNQNMATSVRERPAKAAKAASPKSAAKPAKKS